MEAQDLPSDEIWLVVIDKIKQKYEAYSLKDEKTYPPLSFNWTPEPYQRLIESFEIELASLLGKSKHEIRSMIPSTSTFAQIFRNNYKPKGEKLRGCYLYATGKSVRAFAEEYKSPEISPLENFVLPKSTLNSQLVKQLIIIVSVIGLISFLILFYLYVSVVHPSGLTIEQPVNEKIVPMRIVAKGKVSNAQQVWVVVHNVGRAEYWVQPPIVAKKDGNWKGIIYVGEDGPREVGIRAQVRAFVNPIEPLRDGAKLYSWPEAQLSTNTVEVIRGQAYNERPTKLLIEYPTDGMTIPRQLIIKGKVSNASVVWAVVHGTKSLQYWVQAPIKVAEDGTWMGAIYVGGVTKDHIGLRMQLRVFVNPVITLEDGVVLTAWPEAQLSSKVVEVIRGAKEFD